MTNLKPVDVAIIDGWTGVIGEFLKSGGDGRLIKAATVLPPPSEIRLTGLFRSSTDSGGRSCNPA